MKAVVLKVREDIIIRQQSPHRTETAKALVARAGGEFVGPARAVTSVV